MNDFFADLKVNIVCYLLVLAFVGTLIAIPYFDMAVYESIAFLARMFGVDPEVVKETICDILDFIGQLS